MSHTVIESNAAGRLAAGRRSIQRPREKQNAPADRLIELSRRTEIAAVVCRVIQVVGITASVSESRQAVLLCSVENCSVSAGGRQLLLKRPVCDWLGLQCDSELAIV